MPVIATRNRATWIGAVAALVAVLGWTTPAAAVDGVVLITQAKALAGGVSPADGAGFPVTISAPGSYRLAGSLETTDADTTLIEVRADGVVLDLNGFSLRGPAACSGTPATCTSTGAGNGIAVLSGFGDVTIHDGTIRGMGNAGILQQGSVSSPRAIVVERVNLVGNGGAGVSAADNAVVSRCIAQANGGTGIFAKAGARATENIARDNGVIGISTDAHSSVDGNVVRGSGASGIRVGDGSTISSNVADGNAYGLWGGGLLGVRFTRNAVTNSTNQGIVADDGSKVIENVVADSGGLGISGSATTAYERNVLVGNNGGGANPQVGNGIETGTNLCGGDTTCP